MKPCQAEVWKHGEPDHACTRTSTVDLPLVRNEVVWLCLQHRNCLLRRGIWYIDLNGVRDYLQKTHVRWSPSATLWGVPE